MKYHHLPFHFHAHHWDMEVFEYYLFKALYTIAHATLNLFIPIFLISNGYSLWEVVIWCIINQIWTIAGLPFSGAIINKIGVKHTIALNIPFMALFYIGIQHLSGDFQQDFFFIWLILFSRCIFKGSFQVADDIFMTKHLLKKKKSGKNLAILKIILVSAGIIAPLAGGLVTYFWGFDAIFTSGLVVIFLAGIPLFFTPDEHFKIDYKGTDIFSFTFSKVDKNFIIAEAGRVFPDTLMWILWPIFLYLVIENTANLGAIVSASAFISMVIAFYIGKKVDQKEPEKLLKKATQGAAGVFFLRAFALNPLVVGIIDIANKVLDPILEIPYNFYVYRMIKNHPNPIEMANVKQLIAESLYMFGTLILFVLTYFFTEPSIVLFMIIFGSFAIFYLLMQHIIRVKVLQK